MIIGNQMPNADLRTRLQSVSASTKPGGVETFFTRRLRDSTEKMLNDIEDHLEGFFGDVPLIKLCTLWVAQAHLGRVWSHSPWLYIGLPGNNQSGQRLLDVLKPLMPVRWDCTKESGLPRRVTLRHTKAAPSCGSKVLGDFLQRLAERSTISALIGHLADHGACRNADSARRAVVVTGTPSSRNSAEFAQRAITYTTDGIGAARHLSLSYLKGSYSLRVDLDEWASLVEDADLRSYTKMPDGLAGATADLWRSMLTIADWAGVEWHAWATQLAVQDALSKLYAALVRSSDLVVNEECATSISSWHKSEEIELLAQVNVLMKTRDEALARIELGSPLRAVV